MSALSKFIIFLWFNSCVIFALPDEPSLECILHAPPGLFSSQGSSDPFGGLSGVTGLASLPPQLNSITSDPDAFKSLYDNFKKVFKKDTPATEDNKRMGIFKSQLFNILDHNMKAQTGQSSYEKGINRFSDMTKEEVIDGFTGYKPGNITGDIGKRSISSLLRRTRRDVPDSIDWRDQNAVSPVKDQGQCGSCVLFAATGCLESAWYLKNGGDMLDLSEQELLDCIPMGGGHGGCEGNNYDSTFPYQQSPGQGLESDYPYEAKEGSCRKGSPAANIGEFIHVQSEDEEALREAVGTHGPVAVAINADPIMDYHSHVFDGNCDGHINHAVLITGYGSEDGNDYWLIKNSWGEGWGDQGFFKIKRNAGNLCYVASDAWYMTI